MGTRESRALVGLLTCGVFVLTSARADIQLVSQSRSVSASMSGGGSESSSAPDFGPFHATAAGSVPGGYDAQAGQNSTVSPTAIVVAGVVACGNPFYTLESHTGSAVSDLAVTFDLSAAALVALTGWMDQEFDHGGTNGGNAVGTIELLGPDGQTLYSGQTARGSLTQVPAQYVHVLGAGRYTLHISAVASIVTIGSGPFGTGVGGGGSATYEARLSASYAFGSIVAWGDNSTGACDVPAPNRDFVAVAAGANHSLGLRADGSVAAWGDNTYGQCSVPAPNADFVAVAAGAGHSLGLKADGSIVAWGDNRDAECDVPADNSGFVGVAAGAYHSLGLTAAGSVVAWGRNVDGQCNVPAPNSGFVALAAGVGHSLGLKGNGSIVGWGQNLDGQCNAPGSFNAYYVALAAGGYHSLGLKIWVGASAAWGRNVEGQCNVPPISSHIVAAAGGDYHSLGLTANGSIMAWGSDGNGQCDVAEPNNGFVAIAAGGAHSLGLKLVSNVAPVVDAGADQTIQLPGAVSLTGSASDDGLPNPPGALAYTWSKVSGPGVVTLGDPHAASTSATFSIAGLYVLQLAVSDGDLTGTDTVTVNASAISANGVWSTVVLIASQTASSVTAYDLASSTVIGELIGPDNGALDYANGIAVAWPTIFVASANTQSINLYTCTGRLIETQDVGGTPDGLILRGQGLLQEPLVADSSHSRIRRLQLSTEDWLPDLVPPGDGGLDGAVSPQWSANGNLLVSSAHTNRVLEFDAQTGAFVRVAAQGPELSAPSGLLALADGGLLVASFGTDAVLQYAADGSYVREFVAAGAGGLHGPSGLAWSPTGELLVASRLTDRVLRFDGQDGHSLGDLATVPRPTYLAVWSEVLPDCNGNGIADPWEVVAGTATDRNRNGMLDECERHPGDMNCDGQVNNGDTEAFVLALTDASGYASAYPDCLLSNADCNGDGLVNNGDIDAFVALLTGGQGGDARPRV